MICFRPVLLAVSLLALSACTNSETTDRGDCSADADCEELCSGLAAEDAGELQAFVCNPDLCSCGIKVADTCYAKGGVLGEKEVTCPADEAAVNAAVDTELENR